MAQKAANEADEVTEVHAPDFAAALRCMNVNVKPAEEKNAGSRGDLSGAWKTIEQDYHCNKAGAKAFYKLFNMSAEARDDYLRTLYGLMKTAHIGISQDLVDRMEESDAPSMPVVPSNGSQDGLATLETTH
jgi:hypothetical protein